MSIPCYCHSKLSERNERIQLQMSHRPGKKGEKTVVTVEDVNRVLDIGNLLLSVLTEEEIHQISRQTQDIKLSRAANIR